LHAERLGHGVRVLEDDDLVVEVRERRIPLEVCPSINVSTGIFPSLREHPLPKLLDAGLVVTLNADVPAMTASPVAREFELARSAFGLDDATLAQIARSGVQSSYQDTQAKQAIERQIDAWFADAAISPSCTMANCETVHSITAASTLG
jgi:adenosine deaminase